MSLTPNQQLLHYRIVEKIGEGGIVAIRVAACLLAVFLAMATLSCAKYTEKQIRFTSGSETLEGTLNIPKGVGPFPAIVFAHYSGKQTRESGNYRRLARYVANQGVATFIYDRRGRGKSTGDPHRFIPFQTLAGDLVGAVQAIREHPAILNDRIGVGGMSQAGWVCPLAATLSDDVAFVAVLSAAGVTPDRQELFVQEQRLLQSGHSEAEIAAALDPLKAMTPQERVTSFDPDDKDRNLPFFLFDPLPVWQEVDVPVLAIWGSADTLIPVALSRANIEQALLDGRNPPARFQVYDGAGHELKETPEAKRLLVDWILGLE